MADTEPINGEWVPYCGWPMDSDIVVENKGGSYLLYDIPCKKEQWFHGISAKGEFNLTMSEAIKFRDKLNAAIMSLKKQKEEYDNLCKSHDDLLEQENK